MGDFYGSETSIRDNLIAGSSDLIVVPIVVASGQGALSRGTLLGQITVGGEYNMCDSTAADGSETPEKILAQDIDATDAAVTTTAYESGEFNENAVTFGGTDDADTHRAALEAKKIILRPATAVV